MAHTAIESANREKRKREQSTRAASSSGGDADAAAGVAGIDRATIIDRDHRREIKLPVRHRGRGGHPMCLVFENAVIWTPQLLPGLFGKMKDELIKNPHILIKFRENPNDPVVVLPCSFFRQYEYTLNRRPQTFNTASGSTDIPPKPSRSSRVQPNDLSEPHDISRSHMQPQSKPSDPSRQHNECMAPQPTA